MKANTFYGFIFNSILLGALFAIGAIAINNTHATTDRDKEIKRPKVVTSESAALSQCKQGLPDGAECTRFDEVSMQKDPDLWGNKFSEWRSGSKCWHSYDGLAQYIQTGPGTKGKDTRSFYFKKK